MKFLVQLLLINTFFCTEIIQQFQELEQTNLGSTFFDTIQIALKSREPIETVFDILREQEQSMQQEFEKLDERQVQIQQKCAKDLKDQENVIAMIKKVVIDLQGALDEKLPDRQKKSEQLQIKSKDKESLTQRLDELESRRKKQVETFEKRLEEHQVSITAVKAVREIFEEGLEYIISKSSSFLQVQMQDEEIEKAQAILSYAASKTCNFICLFSLQIENFKMLTGYTSLFTVLNQLSSQTEWIGKHREAIERVLDMCVHLEEFIEYTRTLLRQVDETRENQYNTLFEAMHSDLQNANEVITFLQAEIESLDTSLNVIKIDKQEADQKMETKMKQLEDKRTDCNEQNYNYERRIKLNNEQRELIKRILDLCIENQKDLKQYIKHRNDPFY